MRTIIKTDKKLLELRQLSLADADEYFSLLDASRGYLSQFGDDRAVQYSDPGSVRQSIAESKNPDELCFAVWASFVFVGLIWLIPRGNGVAEAGGLTDARFRNHGYEQLAVSALAQHARKKLGFRRVIARTHPNNVASQGMLAKASFRRFRRTEEWYYFAFAA